MGVKMKTAVISCGLLAGYLLVTCAPAVAADQLFVQTPALAGGQWGLLTPAQRRAYHACLYAAWVQDYCKENSRAVGACIIANGGGGFPIEGRLFTDRYCWYAAQDVAR
jgi:hypothetical protein